MNANANVNENFTPPKRVAQIFDFNTAAKQSERIPFQDTANFDFEKDFQNFANEHGCFFDPIADGEIHRFSVDGDGRGETGGYYKLFDDSPKMGWIGNFRKSFFKIWSSKEESKMTPAEHALFRQRIAAAKQERLEEQKILHEEAAQKAIEIIQCSIPCENHPYLQAKGIRSHNFLMHGGKLIFPLSDYSGKIHSYQTIDANGEKRFLLGGKKKENFFKIEGNETIAICEGIATGASIAEATGWTCIAAMDAGNLLSVAETWRKNNPTAEIIITGDNDSSNVGQDAAQKAAEAVGAVVKIPPNSGMDWNDFHQHNGVESLRMELLNFPSRFGDFPPVTASDCQFDISVEPAPREALLTNKDTPLWLKGDLCILAGAPGAGKGNFLNCLTYEMANGGKFGPIRATRKLRVLCIYAEDPSVEIKRRIYHKSDPKGYWPENLFVVSTMGRMGPIITTDAKSRLPEKTKWFDWVCQSIENLMPLDVVVFDPKMRICAIPENEAHLQQYFIDVMDELTLKYDVSIMFAHHTNKDSVNKKRLDSLMIRGSDAIAGGCRLGFGIRALSEEEGKKFGLKHKEFIYIDTIKHNYVKPFDAPLMFKRGDHGILEYENTFSKVFENDLMAMYRTIEIHDCMVSRNDLRNKKGDALAVLGTLSLQGCPNATPARAVTLVDHLLKKNFLHEEEIRCEGPRPKRMLKFVPVNNDPFDLNQA